MKQDDVWLVQRRFGLKNENVVWMHIFFRRPEQAQERGKSDEQPPGWRRIGSPTHWEGSVKRV